MIRCFFLSLFMIIYHLNTITCAEHVSSTTQLSTPEQPIDVEQIDIITKQHSVKHGSKELTYTSATGCLLTKNQKNSQDSAYIYFTAYFLQQPSTSREKRPVTFCFNGGPGSSSVWLHMGCFGPKIVMLQDQASTPPVLKSYTDNPYSLLSVSDLVFIDPVSTGFSKPAPGVNASTFHSVDGDVNSIAEFIRLFLTKFSRWSSPKYIAGESYGTTRAVQLAAKLQDDYFISCNGLVLISSILDFSTLDEQSLGNDLGYILSLPSCAATAWFHKKIAPQYNKTKLQEFLAEVEEFTVQEYAKALFLGDALSIDQQKHTAQKMSQYLGLPEHLILQQHLRIPNSLFLKELQQENRKILGRFDSRRAGFDHPFPRDFQSYDPSLDNIASQFTDSMREYMHRELGLNKESRYYILNTNVRNWNWSTEQIPAGLGYLNVSGSLQSVCMKNPKLKVFVASGYYDLATPYFATDYTLDHLQLPSILRKKIEQHYYEGGHMMYSSPAILQQLHKDLSNFYCEQ